MRADTFRLADILRLERRYVIPTFQRDYEWTEQGQWRLLFDDLEATTERLLDVRSRGLEGTDLLKAEESVSPHFLGAIVCAAVPVGTRDIAARSVIDGQQRLTTIQLLIRGVLDALLESGSDGAKSLRRMLFNPDDSVRVLEERFKLWPRRKDREVWPVAIGETAPSPEVRDHLYLQARSFFRMAALEFAAEEGVVRPERLDALSDALSTLFKIVVIDLEENDDAQVIFEVLNGRQTPLSAIDLVKNLLFLRGELRVEDVDTLYDEYWTQFDEKWWKEDVGRGHAQRGRRDVLLSAWLTAATGAEANVGHLYREARDYLDDGPSTESVLTDMNSFARAYAAIYEAPFAEKSADDSRLLSSYRRLRALDLTTAVPLLTWLRTIHAQSLNHDDHVRAVRAVESWALRRLVVGWQTRGYGAHFARVLKEAKTATSSSDITDAIIAALGSGSLGWPSDEAVIDQFATRAFYGNVGQPRIRLILSAIDAQVRAESPHEPHALVDYDDLQIEHVLPRSWKAHWPIAEGNVNINENDERWPQLAATRNRSLDRIGNLTLVTGSFNRDVSNLAWSDKRPEFSRQRSLVINYAVADADHWDEAQIEERATSLAEIAVRVWPSPEVLYSGDTAAG